MLYMHLDSDISEESLQEKLLEIEKISKNSTMHFKRQQIVDLSVIPEDQKKRQDEIQFPPQQKYRNRTGLPNYTIYEGKTKHCCRGWCVLGSQPKWALFSFIFFNLPIILAYFTIIPVSIH
jgi:hypothetical protein